MPTPKSVVKVNKKGVQYTSNCDGAQYYIYELTRAALRDVGKFVAYNFKKNYYEHFKKITGDAGKVTKYQVISGAKTEFPRVLIGLKTGRVDGFYAYFQEFGTSKQKRLGLLAKSVEEHIAEIVKIESQYLSALEDEAKALELISEKEYEGDADE